MCFGFVVVIVLCSVVMILGECSVNWVSLLCCSVGVSWVVVVLRWRMWLVWLSSIVGFGMLVMMVVMVVFLIGLMCWILLWDVVVLCSCYGIRVVVVMYRNMIVVCSIDNLLSEIMMDRVRVVVIRIMVECCSWLD